MIRPIDLQATILATQSAPATQRPEDASRVGAQATQAAFAADLARRDESVAAPTEALGNRVDPKETQREKRERKKREQAARTPFEQVVDEAAGSSDEPHIIDFTA